MKALELNFSKASKKTLKECFRSAIQGNVVVLDFFFLNTKF